MSTYTVKEEIVNSITHGMGVLGAISGLSLFAVKAGGGIETVAVIIFTSTMIGMFLMSTLYHAVTHQDAKRILSIIDHSMIYLFIAGTYTPFCLIALKGAWGWSIFGVEWAMAALGISLSFLKSKALKKVEMAAYIMMGWAIVVGFIPLVHAVPASSIVLLIAGGVTYTLGTIWYRMKTVRGAHCVWHIFVVAGAVCHWLSVWFFVN